MQFCFVQDVDRERAHVYAGLGMSDLAFEGSVVGVPAESRKPSHGVQSADCLHGVQDVRVEVATPLARIHPSVTGYVGGYHRWPNNWNSRAAFGVQSFGGAQLLNLSPVSSFTEPVVRLDLDRMDDNDNQLFGVTAEIMWVSPKPAYQLTLLRAQVRGLAAMGLESDVSKLYAKGFHPAILGAFAFLFIATFSFILIKLMG